MFVLDEITIRETLEQLEPEFRLYDNLKADI
jgi:hypothetical protein